MSLRIACEKLDLPYHEGFHSFRAADMLGWSFNGAACVIHPKPDRVWRPWLAYEEAQVCPMLTSRLLEVVIGYFNFLALLCRRLLLLMGSVYVFVLRSEVRRQATRVSFRGGTSPCASANLRRRYRVPWDARMLPWTGVASALPTSPRLRCWSFHGFAKGGDSRGTVR